MLIQQYLMFRVASLRMRTAYVNLQARDKICRRMKTEGREVQIPINNLTISSFPTASNLVQPREGRIRSCTFGYRPLPRLSTLLLSELLREGRLRSCTFKPRPRPRLTTLLLSELLREGRLRSYTFRSRPRSRLPTLLFPELLREGRLRRAPSESALLL